MIEDEIINSIEDNKWKALNFFVELVEQIRQQDKKALLEQFDEKSGDRDCWCDECRHNLVSEILEEHYKN